MNVVNKPVVDVTGATQHFNDTADSLNYYLKDVRRYELLSPEEEKALFKRIKSGDEKAKNELIEANQLFVLAVAKRYSGYDNIMDLVQVGNIGMLQAIDNFNPERKSPDGKSIRFLSYAAWYIRREISFYVINNGLIKRTNNVKTVFKLNRVKNTFYLENGRYPSTEELREIIENEYGIKVKDQSYLYDVETKSLSSTYDGSDKKDTFERSELYNEKSATYNDYNQTIEEDHNKTVVSSLLHCLGEREQDIMKRLFGIGYDREYTMDEVSEVYGMTRERIRQIRNSSLNKLKKAYAMTVSK